MMKMEVLEFDETGCMLNRIGGGGGGGGGGGVLTLLK
jgi:hypothetical protein